MTLIKNLQNLQQENGTLLVTKIMDNMAEKMKMTQLLIDGRNFYDQSINDQIKKYDEIRKIARGKGDNYTKGCLLGY